MDALNDLLLKTAQKDQAAFAQLYTETAPKLKLMCLFLVNNDNETAEDILQEAFIKIWNKAEKYDASKGMPLTWMRTIVRNQTYDLFRSQKSRPELTEEGDYEGIEYAATDLSLDRENGQHHQLTIFNELLEKLPELHQQVVTQSLVYGYSHSEIAEKLQLPLGTVKAWLRRSLKIFQEKMSAEEAYGAF